MDAMLWYHVYDLSVTVRAGSSPWSIPALTSAPICEWGEWSYTSPWTGAGNPVGLSTFPCKSGPGFITETIISKCPTCDTDIQRQELTVPQIHAPFHAFEKGHQKSLIAFVASSVCAFLTPL